MIPTAQERLHQNKLMKIGNGYRLESEISRGPTASIYRAAAPGNGQPVAIKVFHARYHADPRFALRFREHLRRLAGLSHVNLVRVLDYGVDRKHYYMVLEWVEGIDLGTYLTEFSPLPSALCIYIARQVCAALEAIHQHGLIHQGIKSSNILLTVEGQVKVTDVGLNGLLSESGLSKTHVMLSGVGYIPSEQARGKQITPQSDIYSLGATLFEMLTGRLPFESKDVWSMVRMHARETPPSPRQFNLQVPEELVKIVAQALQKDPQLRFSNPGEMDLALFTLEKNLESVSTEMDKLGRRSLEHDLVPWIKGFLDPNTIKSLLRNSWRIAGRSLPFWAILVIQFILAFLIAFMILYALFRFL
jgi:serine/threonine-protein kinase